MGRWSTQLTFDGVAAFLVFCEIRPLLAPRVNQAVASGHQAG